MKNHVLCSVVAVVALSVYGACVTANSPAFLPGPPMICHPFDIGSETSLPAKDAEIKKYDRKNLVQDTLALLTPKTPVIVRMETLRRACVLVSDVGTAKDLLLQLSARALDAEARGKPDSFAWFDAGYFAASLSQQSVKIGFVAGEDTGCEGYLWIKRAIDTGKPDAGMQFAAALATHPAMHKGTHELYDKHIELATKLAEKDSTTEKNILTHCKAWDGELKKSKSSAKK